MSFCRSVAIGITPKPPHSYAGYFLAAPRMASASSMTASGSVRDLDMRQCQPHLYPICSNNTINTLCMESGRQTRPLLETTESLSHEDRPFKVDAEDN